MSHLYIVSTPIGNLKDISQRALRTLNQVDFILCEDTRRTQKLLNHFEIETPTISYHHHSKFKKVNRILKLLGAEKDLALVCDAGTPGIADPGGKLIEKVKKELGEKVKVSPIPGPSAITAALSAAGIPLNRFLFMGYPPKKRKRKKFFQEVIDVKYPVVLFESPHRILKTLKELSYLSHSERPQGAKNPEFTLSSAKGARNTGSFGSTSAPPQDDSLKIILCREITKLHERIYRGAPDEVIKELKKEKPSKGEYTIIIQNK